jgi:hypothetical protein
LLKDWTSIIALGRFSFVVLFGFIGWGFGTAGISILLIWLFSSSIDLKMFAILSVIIFPLLGVLWASDVWKLGQNRTD